MDKLNPLAVVVILFAGSLGYAIKDGHGCAIGLAIASGLCVITEMFVKD